MKNIIIIIVFLLPISFNLFGSGRKDYIGSTEESYFYRFSINDSEQIANNKIFVSERVMKAGFEKFKKINQDEIIIFPLFNLDIYVLEEKIRKNIKDFRVSVPVTISKEFIQETTGVKMTDDYKLYIYLPKGGKWIQMGSRESGITDISNNSKSIDFTIVDWPVDDRMIGCGN